MLAFFKKWLNRDDDFFDVGGARATIEPLIDGCPQRLEVEFDAHGELIFFHADWLDLPEAARKMMAAERVEIWAEKIENWRERLEWLGPLLVQKEAHWHVWPAVLQPLVMPFEALRRRKKEPFRGQNDWIFSLSRPETLGPTARWPLHLIVANLIAALGEDRDDESAAVSFSALFELQNSRVLPPLLAMIGHPALDHERLGAEILGGPWLDVFLKTDGNRRKADENQAVWLEKIIAAVERKLAARDPDTRFGAIRAIQHFTDIALMERLFMAHWPRWPDDRRLLCPGFSRHCNPEPMAFLLEKIPFENLETQRAIFEVFGSSERPELRLRVLAAHRKFLPEMREKIAFSVSKKGKNPVVEPFLLEMLAQSGLEKVDFILAVGRAGGPRSRPLVVEKMRSALREPSKNLSFILAAFEALERLRTPGQGPFFIDLFERMGRENDAGFFIRRAVLSFLGHTPDGHASLNFLREKALLPPPLDGEPPDNETACESIARLGGAHAEAILAETAAKKLFPSLTKRCQLWLGDLRSPLTGPSIRATFADADGVEQDDLRFLALLKTGNRAAADALFEFAEREDDGDRYEFDCSFLRQTAWTFLGLLGDKRAAAPLVALFQKDDKWHKKGDFARALGACGAASAALLLRKNLAEAEADEPFLCGLLEGLGRLKDAASLPVLIEKSADSRPAVAQAALLGLAFFEDEKARRRLEAAAENGDQRPDLAATAARLLLLENRLERVVSIEKSEKIGADFKSDGFFRALDWLDDGVAIAFLGPFLAAQKTADFDFHLELLAKKAPATLRKTLVELRKAGFDAPPLAVEEAPVRSFSNTRLAEKADAFDFWKRLEDWAAAREHGPVAPFPGLEKLWRAGEKEAGSIIFAVERVEK